MTRILNRFASVVLALPLLASVSSAQSTCPFSGSTQGKTCTEAAVATKVVTSCGEHAVVTSACTQEAAAAKPTTCTQEAAAVKTTACTQETAAVKTTACAQETAAAKTTACCQESAAPVSAQDCPGTCSETTTVAAKVVPTPAAQDCCSSKAVSTAKTAPESGCCMSGATATAAPAAGACCMEQATKTSAVQLRARRVRVVLEI